MKTFSDEEFVTGRYMLKGMIKKSTSVLSLQLSVNLQLYKIHYFKGTEERMNINYLRALRKLDCARNIL